MLNGSRFDFVRQCEAGDQETVSSNLSMSPPPPSLAKVIVLLPAVAPSC
jgi:hypothetical protein